MAVGLTTTASASSSSGLPVSFNSITPGSCTTGGKNGSRVTSVAVGQCTIVANQAGNANYYAAPQFTKEVPVEKGAQTIGTIILNPAKLAVDADSTASATTSADLPVNFSSATPDLCTTSGTNGSTVTGHAVGTCTLLANQSGNVNYQAAPSITQSFTVTQGRQTIYALRLSSTLTVGGTTTVSTTTSSGLSAVFSSLTPEICTVSGRTVTGLRAGSCLIAANQTGNVNYQAAPQVSQEFTVEKGGQSIGAIAFDPNTLTVGEKATASATATSSLPVRFSSITPEICVTGGLNGSKITAVSAGRCTVVANQVGDANYLSASQVSKELMVEKGAQTISGEITLTPAKLAVDGNATLSATTSAGLAVSFSSQTPWTCRVSGNQVTGVKVGVCKIAANQKGNANYSATPTVIQNFTVIQGRQTIQDVTFTPSTILQVGGSTTVGATTTSQLLAVFSSTTPEICTVTGTTVNGLTAGTCLIVANQPGDVNYQAAPPVNQSLTVEKGEQSIGIISFDPPTLTVGKTTTASATTTAGLAVSFTANTPEICSTTGINGATITGLTVGTCILTAKRGGGPNYDNAPAITTNLAVYKGKQEITFGDLPKLVVGDVKPLNATGGPSVNTVTFSSTTPEICTVTGNMVKGISMGNCMIAADQAEDANYRAADQVMQTIAVGKGNQTISGIRFSPDTLTVGATVTASAKASSGLSVVFRSTTPDICTTSGAHGTIITGITVGDCLLVLKQAGNANYTEADKKIVKITISE